MKTNWPTKKLGEVCNFIFGFSFRAPDFNNEGRGLPVIRIGDIDKNSTAKFFDGEYNPKYLIKKGDLLIGLSGTIKIAKWQGSTALLNQRVVKLANFDKSIYPDFVYYQLPRVLKKLEAKVAKLTVKNILLPHLQNLEILAPSIKTQKRIVARIEELFEKIDKAKELRKKTQEETAEIFSSALQEVFSKAEKKWGVKKLGEIIELHYGKGIPRKDRKPNGKYPIYGANGELGRTNKYLVKGEAIIIGRKGTAGAVNRASGRFWPADVTYYVFGNKKIDIDFLFYTFKKIDLSQLAIGIKPGINRNKVYELKISFPPLSEQKKIVAYFDALREKVEKLKQLQQNQSEEITELKQSILSKAFKKSKI